MGPGQRGGGVPKTALKQPRYIWWNVPSVHGPWGWAGLQCTGEGGPGWTPPPPNKGLHGQGPQNPTGTDPAPPTLRVQGIPHNPVPHPLAPVVPAALPPSLPLSWAQDAQVPRLPAPPPPSALGPGDLEGAARRTPVAPHRQAHLADGGGAPQQPAAVPVGVPPCDALAGPLLHPPRRAPPPPRTAAGLSLSLSRFSDSFVPVPRGLPRGAVAGFVAG